MQEWYFEDIPLKQPLTTSEYVVTEEELIAFARKWDPLPIHTDPEAARPLIIAGNETTSRYLQPVRPGDRLVATSECVYKRQSRSKPDRGIARFMVTLRNQKGDRVLELESTLVVPRRDRGGP